MARVLVVDDDRDALELRRRILEAKGHEVVIAASAPEARAAAAQFPADCIVLDLRIPDLESGLALIREFRMHRVVVLAGHTGDLDGRPEREMIQALLGKPVRSERLLESIA